MTAQNIIKKYIDFYLDKDHIQIANSPLVPINDPTTLFTSSGMQALVPYLLGEKHPSGTRLVNVQNCIRAQDIEEIGDNRHTTFFRMLGNWSLGDYFKKEQLAWIFQFLTDSQKGLGLDPNRLYVTVFMGENSLEADLESIEIWKKLFKEKGIEANINERIFEYGTDKNWWSRAGIPSNMPPGEPGGPDSEVFYDFQDETIHKNSVYKNEKCHVNCDCGRYIEIANSVFMQYLKTENGDFKNLPKTNVDFGGGLERLILVSENKQDIFKSSLLKPVIDSIHETVIKTEYGKNKQLDRSYRIICDHLVSAVMISSSGIEPSNKERGYVLRRLIRRSCTQKYLAGEADSDFGRTLDTIINIYSKTDPELTKQKSRIISIILEEAEKFNTSLSKGISRWKSLTKISNTKEQSKKLPSLDIENLFDLYQSYGIPFEIIQELSENDVSKEDFDALVKKHQDSSRSASAGMFKGGLADHSERTIMGHTATHLLHQALRDLLGTKVHQTGSNITSERVRFDFNYDNKLTDAQIEKLNSVVNKKISEGLPVHFELIETDKAHKLGAIGLFMDTYGTKSKIYFIGPAEQDENNKPYSIEFCGGPHVRSTLEIKNFSIYKQESLGKNQKRIYCKINF